MSKYLIDDMPSLTQDMDVHGYEITLTRQHKEMKTHRDVEWFEDFGFLYPPTSATWMEWLERAHPLWRVGSLINLKTIPDEEQDTAIANDYIEGFIQIIYQRRQRELDTFLVLTDEERVPIDTPVSALLVVSWFEQVEDRPVSQLGQAIGYLNTEGRLLHSPFYVNLYDAQPDIHNGALNHFYHTLCGLYALNGVNWHGPSVIHTNDAGIDLYQLITRE